MVVNEVGRGRIVAAHTSPGGVPKQAHESVNILADRIEGDDHNDKAGHGGPDRAVVLFSTEIIGSLQGEGHPIFAGSTGENLTVEGLKWDLIVPGTLLRIGPVLLEVTKFAPPCKTIRESFMDGNFNRISHKLFPGWSRVCARVLNPGLVQVGDEIIAEGPIS
jgi:MOSC domain-containing protein YiiM